MRLVSVVVPIYDEVENVEPMYRELCDMASVLSSDRANNSSAFSCEFIFVDDGSTDGTIERLRGVSEGDERVSIVELRRNFGQTAAMAAGFDHAEGEIIVTLDGDLQNDPAEIPRMIAKFDEGYDIVAGWRKDRQDRMLSRKLPSMLANKLISKATNVQLHDYGCTLKVFSAEVAKNIKLYGEMHRYIPAVAAQLGVRIAELPVNHRARVSGTSKYGISRTFRVLLDLLTVRFFLGFSTRPLHMFGGLGMLSGGLGGLFLSVLAVQKVMFSVPIGNRPLLLLGVMLVLIGLQFICFGLLAEVLVRTYHESQNKKTYVVRNIFRSGTAPEDTESKRLVRAL